MPRGWRVIDCSSMSGEICSARGAVSVQPEGKDPVLIPIADVAVLLVGHGVYFSGGALHRCLSAGVAVLLCDWRGVPQGGAFGWSDHSRVAARRNAQALLSEPRRKSAWKAIIKEKIRGQAAALELSDAAGSGFLLELRKQVRSGDPENVEGQAARFYWKKLFGAGFSRVPGTRTGVNGLLDYSYSVLRGFGIRAVLSAGLEPSLGLFHHNRSNPFCLVDDLMEPFRPLVDFYVAKECAEGIPDFVSVKRRLVEIASSKFSGDGLTVPAVFEDFAQHYGKYVEGEIDRLSVPVWSEQNG
ncbi:type II CRISPR-associated endonuclease Cas1 [Gleimia sp. 6138-11-ORH1]|uniref:type II CRISPR-associated endonuclease Cas1 n=1 Tax=Gleimia sp. 6138-11-ORH1 TaxID=2973937 RepID=UPI002167B9CB|nr:type II CRISPR-associated endonuclease Cas1 [Gleimia sp. 6138-11-ORH1]MCS4483928.1 type II CRISPR-associated endonuclease Cas1 [Gleimia sp. 6138-11-ORH1]